MNQLTKIPPQATEIEEAILGAIMLEKSAMDIVPELLNVESFYNQNNALIYKAILTLFNKSEPIDILTVTARLRKDGNLEKVGGAYHVAELTSKINSSSNIESHCRIIQELYMKRELIEMSSTVLDKSYSEVDDVFEVLELCDTSLNNILETNIRGDFSDFASLSTNTLQTLVNAENQELTGLPSGFKSIDKITCGWQPSDLIIIAARPSMGKTALAINIAVNMARDFKKPIGIFSLEMSTDQLIHRIYSGETEINSNLIKGANLNTDGWDKLFKSEATIHDMPLYIDDTGGLSIIEFKAKARRMKSKFNIELIVIDYIQLMQSGDKYKGNREAEVSEISRNLKAIAKDIGVPIIALSQLSRAVESRADKRPILSDLRESGSIEQDADVVMFLFRPEYYDILTDESGNDLTGIGEAIVAKNRNGMTGSQFLKFQGEFTKWSDLESEHQNLSPF